MATETLPAAKQLQEVAASARGGIEVRPRGRPRYLYDPPTDILPTPGVERREFDNYTDSFNGTAEALVAARLLPPDGFPGKPGLPRTSLTLYPRDYRCSDGSRSPGVMSVHRTAAGTFRLLLCIDTATRSARLAEERRREAEGEAAAEALIRELVPLRSLRDYCDHAIVQTGGIVAVEQWFNDPRWLARAQVTPVARRQVLDALQVCRLADVERELARSDMAASRALMARFVDGPLTIPQGRRRP